MAREVRRLRGRVAYHSRLAYVGPASTTSERQPERKTGSDAMSACFSSSVWSCLMHALSSHTRGSATPPRRASSPHETSCSYLAGPGSCQLWLTNPSTCPSFAGAVFSYRPESALLMRSLSCSSVSRRARNRAAPSASASDAEPPPTKAAIVAASASLCVLAPK